MITKKRFKNVRIHIQNNRRNIRDEEEEEKRYAYDDDKSVSLLCYYVMMRVILKRNEVKCICMSYYIGKVGVR